MAKILFNATDEQKERWTVVARSQRYSLSEWLRELADREAALAEGEEISLEATPAGGGRGRVRFPQGPDSPSSSAVTIRSGPEGKNVDRASSRTTDAATPSVPESAVPWQGRLRGGSDFVPSKMK